MTSLNDLLASYFLLQQQKVTEMVAQLDQLRQQFEAQLRKLQKRELGFVSAQEEVLEQIRPLLASDARSLVLTPNFQEYLHTLLEQDIWQYSQLRFQLNTADLSTWLLPTLEFPVQLSNVERFNQMLLMIKPLMQLAVLSQEFLMMNDLHHSHCSMQQFQRLIQ
jgi:hypothetical protein